MKNRRIGLIGAMFVLATAPLWVPAVLVAAAQDRFRKRPGSW